MTRGRGGLSGARSALQGAAPAGAVGAPSGALKRFGMGPNGLFYTPVDPEKGKLWVCSPFDILAEVRSPDGSGWGLLLRWHDRDRKPHEEAFARTLFTNDCGELRTRLADGGLSLNASMPARQAFAEYLGLCRADERVISVSRIGWHQIGERWVYVMPGEVFG